MCFFFAAFFVGKMLSESLKETLKETLERRGGRLKPPFGYISWKKSKKRGRKTCERSLRASARSRLWKSFDEGDGCDEDAESGDEPQHLTADQGTDASIEWSLPPWPRFLENWRGKKGGKKS